MGVERFSGAVEGAVEDPSPSSMLVVFDGGAAGAASPVTGWFQMTIHDGALGLTRESFEGLGPGPAVGVGAG